MNYSSSTKVKQEQLLLQKKKKLNKSNTNSWINLRKKKELKIEPQSHIKKEQQLLLFLSHEHIFYS